MSDAIRICTTTDGVQIAYAVRGEGPPLVKAANWLTHIEFDDSSPLWQHLIRDLSQDRTLVRYDQRGCGLSDWDVEDISFEAWVNDLEAVIDAAGLSSFPLLGISQGGAVSIAYAARHPERVSHLVLYGAYSRGWRRRMSSGHSDTLEALRTLVAQGWGREDSAFRRVLSEVMFPDATGDQLQWLTDLQRESSTAANATRIHDEFGAIDVDELLPKIRVPTLVMHCRGDQRVPFDEGRRMAALIPNARLVALASRNHMVLADEPEWLKFREEVLRFLSETPRRTQATDAAHGSRFAGRAAFIDLPILSKREAEVLTLVAEGYTNAEIGTDLTISPATVARHLTNIFTKIGCTNRTEAARYAIEHGLATRPN